MAAIDLEKEYQNFLDGRHSENFHTKQFLADFAERVREAQMRSDIDFLHEQGYDEASSKLLLSAPIIEINKGDVK